MKSKEREELREISCIVNGMKARNTAIRHVIDEADKVIDRIEERLRKLYEAYLYERK